MRAASARAIASQNAATQEGLERAVAWSRQWSWEFPFCLANHLPMVLVALHRMGASDERLEAHRQIYHKQNGLVSVPERRMQVRGQVLEYVGERQLKFIEVTREIQVPPHQHGIRFTDRQHDPPGALGLVRGELFLELVLKFLQAYEYPAA